MSEQNPNYVPVDWPDDRPVIDVITSGVYEAAATADAELDRRIVLGDVTVADVREQVRTEALLNAISTPEDTDPARETVTLNSAGEPVKLGDLVHHQSDAGTPDRAVGTVTYIGPVTIQDTVVENGAGVQWDGAQKQESHHVDLLTVLL